MRLRRRRVLFGILCVTLALLMAAASTPLWLSYESTTFPTSTGKLIHVRYDWLTVTREDATMGNQILKKYVPSLLAIFREPGSDATVTIHKGRGPCKDPESLGCTSFPSGSTVWINASAWNFANANVWVHEFTHVLQNIDHGPGTLLQGDAQLFYAEPTAMAIENILTPQQDRGLCAPYYKDTSIAVAGFGTAQAAFNYYWNNVKKDMHIQTRVWLALYHADSKFFTELNAHIMSTKTAITNVSALRNVIASTLSVQTLDSRPVDRWLALEGLVGSDEVGSGPFLYPEKLCYVASQPYPALFASIIPIFQNQIVNVDLMNSYATVYDASDGKQLATRTLSGWSESGLSGINLFVELPVHPAAVLVRFHVVSDTGLLTVETVALLPLQAINSSADTSIIMIVTPDMKLVSSSLPVSVDGSNSFVTDGLFTFYSPHMLDVKIASFVLQNIVPDGKILIYVLYPST